jgi:hypothetical protein
MVLALKRSSNVDANLDIKPTVRPRRILNPNILPAKCAKLENIQINHYWGVSSVLEDPIVLLELQLAPNAWMDFSQTQLVFHLAIDARKIRSATEHTALVP